MKVTAPFSKKTKAVFAQSDVVIFTGRLQPFEIRNLLERPRGFDLFDDFLDATQQRGVGDDG